MFNTISPCFRDSFNCLSASFDFSSGQQRILFGEPYLRGSASRNVNIWLYLHHVEGFFSSTCHSFQWPCWGTKKVFRCVVQPTSFFFHCSCKSLRRVVQFEGCGTDVALGFTRVAYFLTSTPRISPGSGIWEKSYTFRSAISPSLSVSKVLLRRDFSGPGWLVKKQSHVEAVYESSYGPMAWFDYSIYFIFSPWDSESGIDG